MTTLDFVGEIHLQQICSLFPGMLQIIDSNGQVMNVSERWLDVLGYARSDVVGQPYARFLSRESCELLPFPRMAEMVERSEIYEVECEFVRQDGATLPFLLSAKGERDDAGGVVRYWVSLTDMRKPKRTELMLRSIAAATATQTGDAYFNTLAHQLVQTYGVSSAFVTQCANERMTQVRTLALMQNSTLVENIEYDLAGTPCAGVIGGSVCYYPEKLDEMFPREAGKSSFLGVPFYDSRGNVLGHVAIMDEKPLRCDANDVALLEIFAARSGAELECQIKARALRQRTEELDGFYAQLQDQNRHLEEMVSARTHEIEQRRQVAESLREMVMLLNSDRPLAEMLAALLADATRLLNTESGALFLLNPDSQTLTIRTIRGLPAAYATNLTVPVEQSLMGQAILNRQPVVISNISSALHGQQVEVDAQWRSLLSSHYQTLLTVPLVRQAVHANSPEVYGCIALYYPQHHEFSSEEIHLAAAFSAQAALAIENATLRQRVQQAAILEERTRLARELHDSVTQSLYSLTLLAEGWRFMAQEGRPLPVAEALTELGELGQQALKEMRLLIHELRPPVLENERLLGALHKRLAAVEKRAGVETSLVADELVDLPPAQEEALYAIAQEALNNALKHAAATAVNVRLRIECGEQGEIALEIADNGRGFDPAQAGECGGLGLMTMSERAGRIGGQLLVDSVPEVGTTITVIAPYPEREAQHE